MWALLREWDLGDARIGPRASILDEADIFSSITTTVQKTSTEIICITTVQDRRPLGCIQEALTDI